MSSVICNLFLTKLLKVKLLRLIQVENTVFTNFVCSKSVFSLTEYLSKRDIFILILYTVDGCLRYIYWAKALCILFIHT